MKGKLLLLIFLAFALEAFPENTRFEEVLYKWEKTTWGNPIKVVKELDSDSKLIKVEYIDSEQHKYFSTFTYDVFGRLLVQENYEEDVKNGELQYEYLSDSETSDWLCRYSKYKYSATSKVEIEHYEASFNDYGALEYAFMSSFNDEGTLLDSNFLFKRDYLYDENGRLISICSFARNSVNDDWPIEPLSNLKVEWKEELPVKMDLYLNYQQIAKNQIIPLDVFRLLGTTLHFSIANIQWVKFDIKAFNAGNFFPDLFAFMDKFIISKSRGYYYQNNLYNAEVTMAVDGILNSLFEGGDVFAGKIVARNSESNYEQALELDYTKVVRDFIEKMNIDDSFLQYPIPLDVLNNYVDNGSMGYRYYFDTLEDELVVEKVYNENGDLLIDHFCNTKKEYEVTIDAVNKQKIVVLKINGENVTKTISSLYPTAVDEVTKKEVFVYPTIINKGGTLTIKGAEQKYLNVYDVNGTNMMKKFISDANYSFSLNLSEGFYFLQIDKETVKIIIK